MKATALEFRLRMAIMTIVVVLGFWAPWIEAWGIGQRISLLEWMALELSRLGLLSFAAATPAVIILGSVIAAIGAFLRVWGSAWLGYGTVHHGSMQAGGVVANGPYRHVRNPLYLGGWFMIAAMAFIMPPTGALFVVPLLTVFFLRLIFGEEAFLAARLGQPYLDYLRAVPRLLPRLRAALPSAGGKPQWIVALLSELNPIGVFITLAFLSWTYNNLLMVKAIVIAFGLSMVVRALIPSPGRESDSVE